MLMVGACSMNKMMGLFAIAIVYMCLSACAKGAVGESTTAPATSGVPTTRVTAAAEDEAHIWKQGDNFTIYIYKDADGLNGFRYEIFDEDHCNLDFGDFGWRGGEIAQNGDEVVLSYGSGGPVVQKRYYDVKRGRVSAYFANPVCENEDKVAYYAFLDQKNYVVVQDKYDRAAYYKSFQRNFSSAFAFVNANAFFSADGKTLTATYPVMENGREVEKTEVFPLN